jgi:hypothetical protein
LVNVSCIEFNWIKAMAETSQHRCTNGKMARVEVGLAVRMTLNPVYPRILVRILPLSCISRVLGSDIVQKRYT